MKYNLTGKHLVISTVFSFLLNSAVHATVLISNDFGAGADVGPAFQEVANGFQSGSSDPSTGIVTTGGLGPGPDFRKNSSYGLNTSGAVDVTGVAGSVGFTIEWTVSSMSFGGANGNTDDIDFNGFFFGVTANTNATGTAGSSLWNNNPNAVGLSLFLPNDGGGNEFNMHFLQEDGGGNNFAVQTLGVADPTTASLCRRSGKTYQ